MGRNHWRDFAASRAAIPSVKSVGVVSAQSTIVLALLRTLIGWRGRTAGTPRGEKWGPDADALVRNVHFWSSQIATPLGVGVASPDPRGRRR
jgi:hypothetical protein